MIHLQGRKPIQHCKATFLQLKINCKKNDTLKGPSRQEIKGTKVTNQVLWSPYYLMRDLKVKELQIFQAQTI